MAFVNQLGASIIEPLFSIWNSIVNIVPGLVGAIVVLVFGYLVGVLFGRFVQEVLDRAKAEKWLVEKTNLVAVLGYFKLSKFVALITKWYVFILFLPPAASIVQLAPLATFLLALASWVPSVIAATLLALIGLMSAKYVEKKISETKAKAADLVGSVAKVIIVIFTVLLVLDQVGVRVAVAQTSFLIILAGVMLGIALMTGIGFGLAFKEEASHIIKDVKKKL